MNDKIKINSKNRVYDLEERTAVFGENIIDFCKSIKKDIINSSIITQLIRSGTSIGANYNEADCAESKKDFIHKLEICKKESKETKHWLRMISRSNQETTDTAKTLWIESNELQLIFISIINKTKNNLKK
jgi:four helix bundle protein